MHPFDSRAVPGHTARMLIGLCICTHTQAQSNEWKVQRENAQRHEREWASTSDDFQWKWDSSRRMPTAALLCTRQLGQKNGKCSKKAHTSTKVDGHQPSKTFEENLSSAGAVALGGMDRASIEASVAVATLFYGSSGSVCAHVCVVCVSSCVWLGNRVENSSLCRNSRRRARGKCL